MTSTDYKAVLQVGICWQWKMY